MIVTNRDKEVLLFIEKFKVATTDTIWQLFYPSLRVSQTRLKLLHDNKLIKRDRDHFTSQYYYYIRKPRQLRHDLLLTDFYREMDRKAEIELFKKEFTIGDIRSDGLIAYKNNHKRFIAFIEVQISNTPLDIKKYEKLYKTKLYKNYFPAFPLIYAITDKSIPSTNLKIIKINEDMSNLKK